MHRDSPVITSANGEPHLAIDRHRQDESVVIVGVIADQVHAPRGAREERRLTAEAAPELLDYTGAQLTAHSLVPMDKNVSHRRLF